MNRSTIQPARPTWSGCEWVTINRVIFTPWLNGERTPVDDHTLRAGWHNLSLAATRAEMVRSVLEGVAYNSRWLLATV